jgi:hypothetical protein
VYSTGNFIFDQVDNEGTRSDSLDVSVNTKYDTNLAKWLKLGETCKTFHDNCFEQAKAQSLTKPDLALTFDMVAGDNSGHLTKRAGPAVQQAVEARTNWTATLQALGQTPSAR